MQWTAPAAGIAMCQNVVALAATRESAYGYKPPWTGSVEALSGLSELHALIMPPDLLHLTQPGHPRHQALFRHARLP